MRSGVELKDIEESWPKAKAKVQHTRPSTSLHSISKKDDANILKSLYGFLDEAHAESLTDDELGCTQYIDKFDILACTEYSDENLEELAGEELACTKHLDEFQEELASDEIRSTAILDKLQGKSKATQAKDCSNISSPDMCVNSDDEVGWGFVAVMYLLRIRCGIFVLKLSKIKSYILSSVYVKGL